MLVITGFGHPIISMVNIGHLEAQLMPSLFRFLTVVSP